MSAKLTETVMNSNFFYKQFISNNNNVNNNSKFSKYKSTCETLFSYFPFPRNYTTK